MKKYILFACVCIVAVVGMRFIGGMNQTVDKLNQELQNVSDLIDKAVTIEEVDSLTKLRIVKLTGEIRNLIQAPDISKADKGKLIGALSSVVERMHNKKQDLNLVIQQFANALAATAAT